MTERVVIRDLPGMAKGAVGMATKPFLVSVVIPAKAGIQDRRGGGVKGMPPLACGIKLSFRLPRECIINPLDSGLPAAGRPE